MLVDEERLYKQIGEQLKSKRLDKRMSQAELGAEVGRLHSSIANIEAGKQRVPLRTLYDLCNALDLEPRDILPTVADLLGPEMLSPITVFGETLPATEKTAKAVYKLIKKSRSRTIKKSGADR